jgi:hypothetical protein
MVARLRALVLMRHNDNIDRRNIDELVARLVRRKHDPALTIACCDVLRSDEIRLLVSSSSFPTAVFSERRCA